MSKSETGIVSLITPSTYLMKPLSKKIRQFLLFKHNILRIDEFKGMVFKAVVPTSIIIFKKTDEVNINNKISTKHFIKEIAVYKGSISLGMKYWTFYYGNADKQIILFIFLLL